MIPSTNGSPRNCVLLISDLNEFLEQQVKDLQDKRVEYQKLYPDDGKMITFHEAIIISALQNTSGIAQTYRDSVFYVEEMMRLQLVSAIGKEVTATDFADYMTYHNKKFFHPKFSLRPFAYAVRQPECSPEGVISIERKSGVSEPVSTFVRERISTKTPMEFSISASTKVSLCHAYAHLFRSSFMEIVMYMHLWNIDIHVLKITEVLRPRFN